MVIQQGTIRMMVVLSKHQQTTELAKTQVLIRDYNDCAKADKCERRLSGRRSEIGQQGYVGLCSRRYYRFYFEPSE